jgi:hypothetical protein
MVFVIGLGMTVLSNTENGFFCIKQENKLRLNYEKRTPTAAGIVSSGV